MAQISIAILNDALENVCRVLVDDSPSFDHYGGLGIGESSTAAAAGQHDLQGSDTKYKDVAGTYEGSYVVKWQRSFGYEDLVGHVLKEIVVCQDKDNHNEKSLLRATFDAITLSVGEVVISSVEVTLS